MLSYIARLQYAARSMNHLYYFSVKRRSKASDSIQREYKLSRTVLLFYSQINNGSMPKPGGTYASSPLYKLICQKTGFGGTPNILGHGELDIDKMKPPNHARANKKYTIFFTANKSSLMPWKFNPCQYKIQAKAGETVLAFYTAENPTTEDIIGVATYNIVPSQAAQYFNKIQCFCFEEQKLGPGEIVDMPVYFYLDPDILKDALLEDLEDIVLSYTFFPAKNT